MTTSIKGTIRAAFIGKKISKQDLFHEVLWGRTITNVYQGEEGFWIKTDGPAGHNKFNISSYAEFEVE
jgi:hypothetical protein